MGLFRKSLYLMVVLSTPTMADPADRIFSDVAPYRDRFEECAIKEARPLIRSSSLAPETVATTAMGLCTNTEVELRERLRGHFGVSGADRSVGIVRQKLWALLVAGTVKVRGR